MILGFVEMDGDTFYGDIWPRIKDDVEILESIRDGAKKGVCPVIIKWGYKDDTKEKIILAISRLGQYGREALGSPDLDSKGLKRGYARTINSIVSLLEKIFSQN